jgi:hypothetical protein
MRRKLYAPDPIRKNQDVPILVRQPFKAERPNHRMKTEEDRVAANDRRLLKKAIKILENA